MARVHVTGGVLEIESASLGYPDQGLPPGSPGIPAHPIELPPPPPTVWPSPPPSVSHPIVPAPPGTPPGVIWPNPHPPRPDQGLPPSQGRPDQGLPGDQPHPDQGLPGSQPHPDHGLPGQPVYPDHALPNTYWALCYTPQYGWRYISYDPSLTIGYPLPPHAAPK